MLTSDSASAHQWEHCKQPCSLAHTNSCVCSPSPSPAFGLGVAPPSRNLKTATPYAAQRDNVLSCCPSQYQRDVSQDYACCCYCCCCCRPGSAGAGAVARPCCCCRSVLLLQLCCCCCCCRPVLLLQLTSRTHALALLSCSRAQGPCRHGPRIQLHAALPHKPPSSAAPSRARFGAAQL
jgi:hypothetical protein